MSAYRGEPVNIYAAGTDGGYVPGPDGGPDEFTPDYDAGVVPEMCLGEVADVLQLTNLILNTPYPDSIVVSNGADSVTLDSNVINAREVLMWGYSHGACVTDRAVEQGAPATAAATFAEPTDIETWFADCLAEQRQDKCCTCPQNPYPSDAGCVQCWDLDASSMCAQDNPNNCTMPRAQWGTVLSLFATTGYVPSSSAPFGATYANTNMTYAWRSPDYLLNNGKGTEAYLPFVRFQGAADPEIQVHQACTLSAEIGTCANFYLPMDSDAAAPCEGTISWAPSMPDAGLATDAGSCSLVVYGGANHGTILVAAKGDFLSWVNSLHWTTTVNGKVDLIDTGGLELLGGQPNAGSVAEYVPVELDAGSCSCTGTDDTGAPVTAFCGETVCGTGNQLYGCEPADGGAGAWSYIHAGCELDAGGCYCNGMDNTGAQVTVSCGQSLCAWGNKLYACESSDGGSAAWWSYVHAGCEIDAGSCYCNGTDNTGAPVTVSCGQSVCGSGNQLYACESSAGGAGAWSFVHAGCELDAGSCYCNGTDNTGAPVTVSCGQTVCGSGNQLYACESSAGGAGAWSYVHAGCELDAGSCYCNGTDNTGAPVTVSCGQTVCGSGNQLYACKSSAGGAGAWSYVHAGCELDAGSCYCNGTDNTGAPVTASCGQSVCGSGNQLYACVSTDGGAGAWSYVHAGCELDAGSCYCNGTDHTGAQVTVSCGQSVCGSGDYTYTCLSSGTWSGGTQGCCTNDSNCWGSSGGLACDTTTRTCVSCVPDGHTVEDLDDCAINCCSPSPCTSGTTCGPAVIGFCSTDADCTGSSSGPACDTTTHTCVPCVPVGDTADVAADCTSDCCNPSPCASGTTCSPSTSRICSTDADCTGSSGGPACDTTTYACVSCVPDGDLIDVSADCAADCCSGACARLASFQVAAFVCVQSTGGPLP